MHNYQHYIGIDVSKETLAIAVVSLKRKIFLSTTTNDPKQAQKNRSKVAYYVQNRFFPLHIHVLLTHRAAQY